MTTHKKQKLYVYVDETGQDAGSNIFIVAAVIAWDDIEMLRSILLALEQDIKVGSKKWHKLRHASRVEFMNAFLREQYEHIQIYFGRFPKPIPSFFPTLEVIQKSLVDFPDTVQAIINIDGLDVVSAKKMTNALRTKHRHLKLVKGPKDESEVLIRLADRWAGVLRLAYVENSKDCQELVARARKKALLKEI
jgi:hypothetical protein